MLTCADNAKAFIVGGRRVARAPQRWPFPPDFPTTIASRAILPQLVPRLTPGYTHIEGYRRGRTLSASTMMMSTASMFVRAATKRPSSTMRASHKAPVPARGNRIVARTGTRSDLPQLGQL